MTAPRVVGVTMVRDEADIIASTIRVMLTHVDQVLIADNGSTDGTREILDDLSVRYPVVVTDDPEVGYWQAEKITRLAGHARELGAEWVIPCDADEAWLTRTGRSIKDVLLSLPDTVRVASADLWDHVATGQDPDEPDPLVRIGWRRSHPAALPKVAVRPLEGLRVAQGNHAATYEDQETPVTVTGLLTIRHFPYRSTEQTIRKIRNGAQAYAATDLPPEQGAHWRQWGQFTDEQIADLFRKWHWRADPTSAVCIDGEHQPPLVYDPVPAPACVSRS